MLHLHVHNVVKNKMSPKWPLRFSLFAASTPFPLQAATRHYGLCKTIKHIRACVTSNVLLDETPLCPWYPVTHEHSRQSSFAATNNIKNQTQPIFNISAPQRGSLLLISLRNCKFQCLLALTAPVQFARNHLTSHLKPRLCHQWVCVFIWCSETNHSPP